MCQHGPGERLKRGPSNRPAFFISVASFRLAYVHRIAVRRQFAGQGVSTGMLEWAVNHAAALGRSYLRLDCEADRRELRSIYERFGFRLHSYRDVGPYHLSRYEYVINAQ